MEVYKQDESFEKIIFKNNALPLGEYENCSFRGCDFSDTDLSGMRFVECDFVGCNLSLVKLSKTAFQQVRFKDCKLLGLHFNTCNEFGLALSFEGCTLNHSTFFKTKIKKTIFKNCSLHEVDFTQADLSAAVFDNCDLRDASFENTTLEKADLRSSFHYSLDPEQNKIRKARFSLNGVPGLLNKYDIEIEY